MKKCSFLILLLSLILLASNSRVQKPDYVAVVGGVGITKEAYQKELDYQNHFLNWARQNATDAAKQVNVLEQMTHDISLSQYAAKQGITVNQEELEELESWW